MSRFFFFSFSFPAIYCNNLQSLHIYNNTHTHTHTRYKYYFVIIQIHNKLECVLYLLFYRWAGERERGCETSFLYLRGRLTAILFMWPAECACASIQYYIYNIIIVREMIKPSDRKNDNILKRTTYVPTAGDRYIV